MVRVESSAMFSSDLDVAVGIDLVALHDLVGGNFLACVGIDPEILDPVTGVPIYLIEADFLGVGRRRVQCDRIGDEGKAQKALPIGARGHDATPEQNATEPGLKPGLMDLFRPAEARCGEIAAPSRRGIIKFPDVLDSRTMG